MGNFSQSAGKTPRLQRQVATASLSGHLDIALNGRALDRDGRVAPQCRIAIAHRKVAYKAPG
eukprot:COSAG02_NODE_986_length_15452_cov_17.818602_5_plen_62_part_00